MSRDTNSINLQVVLQDKLNRIDGAKSIVISTFDGAELLSVTNAKQNNTNRPGVDGLQVIHQFSPIYTATSEQIDKLGLGSNEHSITWIDDGILVQSKLEAAVVSIYLESTANLGILEEEMEKIRRLLQPFTTTNFISSNI